VIYCVGDCHASFFSGYEDLIEPWPHGKTGDGPYFRATRIERVSVSKELMWKIDRISKVIDSLNISENDYLLLVYGEPDCRRDIPKFLTEHPNADYHETINSFAQEYIKCIEFFNKKYNMIILGVFGQGVTPRNSYYTQKKRNKIVVDFNWHIGSYCAENDIPFVNIFDDMVDDGTTKRGWLKSDLDIHLSQKAMPTVLKKFKDMGLI